MSPGLFGDLGGQEDDFLQQLKQSIETRVPKLHGAPAGTGGTGTGEESDHEKPLDGDEEGNLEATSFESLSEASNELEMPSKRSVLKRFGDFEDRAPAASGLRKPQSLVVSSCSPAGGASSSRHGIRGRRALFESPLEPFIAYFILFLRSVGTSLSAS